jgi:hypothetical protein
VSKFQKTQIFLQSTIKKYHLMKSVMKHQFSQVPQANIRRSKFDRSHAYKTTFDSGLLIPFFVDEALPGDTFSIDPTILARLATPIYPIMDNMFLDVHFFAVPNRLLWDNWQKFMGERTNPDDSIDYTLPQIEITTGHANAGVNTLVDYFGLPPSPASTYYVSSLPFRAYNLIYNEWFRDQNLQDSVVVDTGDGPDDIADYELLRRGKRHDYFTSALPWPQKGPGVELPLGSTAPVLGIGKANQTFSSGPLAVYETAQSSTTLFSSTNSINVGSGGGTFYVEEDPNNPGYPGIFADLSNATAATINSIREAFTLQQMLEKDARGGTRYVELIRSHFGVVSPDARLQRPEYLGGGSTPLIVNPVQQTTSTDATSPQGNLAAYAVAISRGKGFVKSFTEHCTIIGLMSARADLTYQQGIQKMWSRSTRYDFFWPTLAHLGEQPVYNKEIYWQGSSADADVFGYQERYAEYRYHPSKITGTLRSTHPQSLDAWHLSQEFGSLPTLGSTFIEENPPVDRVVAVPSEPDFIADAYIRFKAVRPMPIYSVPGLNKL